MTDYQNKSFRPRDRFYFYNCHTNNTVDRPVSLQKTISFLIFITPVLLELIYQEDVIQR